MCDDLLDGPALFVSTARAALRYRGRDRNDCYLPPPLARVRELPYAARSCFILRCLAGLSTDTVSELLLLHPHEVSQHTADGMKLLSMRAAV
jgi:hypothetical protein